VEPDKDKTIAYEHRSNDIINVFIEWNCWNSRWNYLEQCAGFFHRQTVNGTIGLKYLRRHLVFNESMIKRIMI
jgi:hypothetical protein